VAQNQVESFGASAEHLVEQSLVEAEIQEGRNRPALHIQPCLVEVSEADLRVLVVEEFVLDLEVVHLVDKLAVVVVGIGASR
jgi:hypothetical protein